mmetsp:Transcript_14850/g.37738  ORF Transcript_14850/g.37738 Transcript_14850/m.37738 type:complete len:456 (+) Transcript_14850:86-1453(+)
MALKRLLDPGRVSLLLPTELALDLSTSSAREERLYETEVCAELAQCLEEQIRVWLRPLLGSKVAGVAKRAELVPALFHPPLRPHHGLDLRLHGETLPVDHDLPIHDLHLRCDGHAAGGLARRRKHRQVRWVGTPGCRRACCRPARVLLLPRPAFRTRVSGAFLAPRPLLHRAALRPHRLPNNLLDGHRCQRFVVGFTLGGALVHNQPPGKPVVHLPCGLLRRLQHHRGPAPLLFRFCRFAALGGLGCRHNEGGAPRWLSSLRLLLAVCGVGIGRFGDLGCLRSSRCFGIDLGLGRQCGCPGGCPRSPHLLDILLLCCCPCLPRTGRRAHARFQIHLGLRPPSHVLVAFRTIVRGLRPLLRCRHVPTGNLTLPSLSRRRRRRRRCRLVATAQLVATTRLVALVTTLHRHVHGLLLLLLGITAKVAIVTMRMRIESLAWHLWVALWLCGKCAATETT